MREKENKNGKKKKANLRDHDEATEMKHRTKKLLIFREFEVVVTMAPTYVM